MTLKTTKEQRDKYSRLNPHQWVYDLCHDADRARELEKELETERMRLAGCGVAALGYFTECADEYKSASLNDVLRLYQEAADLRAKLDTVPMLTPSDASFAYALFRLLTEARWPSSAPEWAAIEKWADDIVRRVGALKE